MFPMMLVLSLACTLDAHAYYSMQLPLTFYLSFHTSSPADQCPIYAPSYCTIGLDSAPTTTHFLGARILITLSFSTHPAALISALPHYT